MAPSASSSSLPIALLQFLHAANGLICNGLSPFTTARRLSLPAVLLSLRHAGYREVRSLPWVLESRRTHLQMPLPERWRRSALRKFDTTASPSLVGHQLRKAHSQMLTQDGVDLPFTLVRSSYKLTPSTAELDACSDNGRSAMARIATDRMLNWL